MSKMSNKVVELAEEVCERYPGISFENAAIYVTSSDPRIIQNTYHAQKTRPIIETKKEG